MKKIGIVLVNYDANEYTLSCLKSLSEVETGGLEAEVIIVDNNSSEPFKVVKDYGNFKTSLITNKKNEGFAKGTNIGIKEALRKGCEYILILNNDTTHDRNFLKALLSSIEKSSAGIVSPKIYFSKGREFHKDKYENKDLGKVIWYAGGIIDWKNVLASHRGVDEVDKGQFDEVYDSDFATGCAMLVGKEVFEKIGYFDERYFLYLEDLEFSVRAKKAGFGIGFAPSSLIWHYNAGSTGGSGSNLHDYFITRNRLLFGFKYAQPRAKMALVRESVKLLFLGRNWQKRGIMDFYLGRFGKGSLSL